MRGNVLHFGVVFFILFFLTGSSRGEELEKATFAGGCFWCMEASFEHLKGVKSVVSGYIGGQMEKPTYKDVSHGDTGHAEAIQVTFDPAQVNYAKLLDVFWQNIDPTTLDRQFVDEGSQYRTEIFYHNDEQRRLAEESKTNLEQSGKFSGPIVTKITAASTFYPAEEYHQDYYKKNPLQYKVYHYNSGRGQFLDRVWGKNREK